MCLTVPRRVVEVKGDRALLQDGRWVKTTMVGKVKVGEMVLAQANVAVEKISRARTKKMKALMTQQHD